MTKSHRIKTIISVLLTVIMVISVVSVMPTANAADKKQLPTADTEYSVSTAAQLNEAVTAISAAESGTYNIIIGSDFSVTGGVAFNNPDAVVNVFGEGHTISFSGTSQGFDVMNGTTLNLGAENYDKTLTLSGDGIAEVDGGLIYINNVTGQDPPNTYNTEKQAVCNMYDGVTVKNHIADSNYGGGVTVEGAIFNMYGGTIEKCGIDGGSVCYGGGVGVAFGGQFTMYGGKIKDCTVKSELASDLDPKTTYIAGGGVFVYCGSSFVMKGGEIDGCKAINLGDEKFSSVGGGVALITSVHSANSHLDSQNMPMSGYLDACFKMEGGTIKGCSADFGGGLGAGRIKGQLDPSLTSEPYIPANPNTPGIVATGGTIQSNTANVLGGGIDLYWIRQEINITFSNLSLIGNSAPEGGAVCIDEKWTNATFSNCSMTNNHATNGKGGAIYLFKNDKRELSVTTLDSCTITYNTATDKGAGVYYSVASDKNDDSVLAIKGANIIQNNKVGDALNNLYFQGYDHPVLVTGSLAGSQIGITDARLWEDNLEDTDSAALSFEALTEGFEEYNTKASKAEYFTSDHDSWVVDDGGEVYSNTTFYQYQAKKYLTNPPLTKGYSIHEREGANGTEYYIILDISPNVKWTTSGNNLFPALKSILDNEYGEGIDMGSNQYYYEYSEGGDSGDYFILWNRTEFNINIYTYSYGQLTAILQGAGGVQSFAGVDHIDGKMALKLNWYDPDYDPTIPTFNSTASSIETVEYETQLTDNKIEYLSNDIGLVSEKLIVDKSSETVVQKPSSTPINYSSEVRLVRRTAPVRFHDNKNSVNEGEDKLFRVYNGDTDGAEDTTAYTLTNGKVEAFYNIPSFAEDDYVFAGWYYNAADGTTDGDTAFDFTKAVPANVTDVYAHWIPVGTVEREDGKTGSYGGFELIGVQIRPAYHFDTNYEYSTPGGLRFITSISENLLSSIDSLSDKTVGGNKVEYGFVTAAKNTVDTVVGDNRMGIDASTYKIQYKGENVNGVDTLLNNKTSDERKTPNNFRYITNVDCTSKQGKQGGYGGNANIKIDHQNYTNYRLATYVVTYNNHPENKTKDIVARAYLRYYDANGLLRTFYNDYTPTNVYGGCSISYEKADELSNTAG